MKKLLIILFLLPVVLGAIPPREVEPDTTRSLTIYPAMFYSDEMGFGGGAMAIFLHRPPGRTEHYPSNSVFLSAIYTSHKQFASSLRPSVQLFEARWMLSGEFKYVYWPDSFFGLGNDTSLDDEERFTTETTVIELNLLRRFGRYWGVEMLSRWRQWSLHERETDGALLNGEIPGASGARILGLGLSAVFDDRDNEMNPHRGGKIEIQCHVYNEALGSDFAWTKYKLDAFRFYRLGEHSVLGFQALGVYNDGEPPFLEMASPGCEMRGISTLRYLGRHMALGRVELRTYPFSGKILSRMGFAVFAETGRVANEIDQFALRGMRYSVGGGLRFMLVPSERLTLRLDVGFSADESGFTITSAEAF
ncbi:MAG: BamA/TamA family outer membrane protein [Candidatus Cloacimonetes bacterium]|nr:BamA/TamA family outer membrane protein [Candidatus Cloacimonadota bacterium]